MEEVPTIRRHPGSGDREARRATRVYLARHGQTPLNSAGLLRGHLDPHLDAVGRNEAQRLASALVGRDIGIIVTSPLRRAVETAEAVASRVGQVVRTDSRFVDRNYGRWAGQPRKAVEEKWGSLDHAPGVESGNEVRARALDGLDDLVARETGGVALVVSHDAVLRVLLVTLDPELGEPDGIPQETGCFNTVDRIDGRWTVVGINETPEEPARAEGRKE